MSFTRLFFFGSTLLAFAIYILFHDLFFNETKLVKIKGKLENVSVFTQVKRVPRRYFGEDIYNYVVLRFKLKQINQNFELNQNIDKIRSSDNDMERISSLLKNSEDISVSIRESDIKNLYPEIYRIDLEKYNAYNHDNKEQNKFYLFFLLTGMSAFFFVLHFIFLKLKASDETHSQH